MTLQISIRDERPAEPQPVMKLWLEQDGSSVYLKASDSRDRPYRIAVLYKRGIELIGHIPPETGWPLDGEGRLGLVTE